MEATRKSMDPRLRPGMSPFETSWLKKGEQFIYLLFKKTILGGGPGICGDTWTGAGAKYLK